MLNKKYYSLVVNEEKKEADLNIFGDITSYADSWWSSESDMSVNKLSKELESLQDVDTINVNINSYGGEVAEGLAIYNTLKNHKAKIKTCCTGFACSIASVIFMAGEERIMNEASLLMIHNAWTYASGNANELRKQADDLEKITQASINAYKAHSSLTEEEIKQLLDNESWILPSEALEYGFATMIEGDSSTNPNQSAGKKVQSIVKAYKQAAKEPENEPKEPKSEPKEPEDEPKEPEDEPKEPEDEPKEPKSEPKEPEDEPEDDETTQKWSGFFNAILNL